MARTSGELRPVELEPAVNVSSQQTGEFSVTLVFVFFLNGDFFFTSGVERKGREKNKVCCFVIGGSFGIVCASFHRRERWTKTGVSVSHPDSCKFCDTSPPHFGTTGKRGQLKKGRLVVRV